MANNTVNVRVNRYILIEALKKKLAKITEDYEKQGELKKKFQRENEAWQKKVAASIPKSVKPTIRVSVNAYGVKDDEVEVTLDYTISKSLVPDPPKQPVAYYEHTYKDDRETLTSAIRLLEMSDDETISTSSYKSVARYL
jgi:hypothetical protein